MPANEVFIHLARAEYNPGEVVNGAILVRIGQPIRATGVTLKLTGRERTEWVESRKGQAEPVSGYKHFYKTVIQVATFPPNQDHSGEFRFPFSFTLPKNIPGSHVLQFGSSVSSSILYKVKAVVQLLGIKKSHIKFTQCVHVKQINPLNSVLARNDPIPNYCLCIPQPGVFMEIAVDKPAYHAGETMCVLACIKNGTSSRITSLSLILKMHVELNSTYSTGDLSVPANRRRQLTKGGQFKTEQTIASASFPPIEPKAILPCAEFRLDIPRSIHQHCFGFTTRIFYSAELRCNMDLATGDLQSNLLAKIPVALYPTDSSLPKYVKPGHGFNPITYQGIVGHVPFSVQAAPSFPMHLFINVVPITSSYPGPRRLEAVAPPLKTDVPDTISSVVPEERSSNTPITHPTQNKMDDGRSTAHQMEQASPKSPVEDSGFLTPVGEEMKFMAA